MVREKSGRGWCQEGGGSYDGDPGEGRITEGTLARRREPSRDSRGLEAPGP